MPTSIVRAIMSGLVAVGVTGVSAVSLSNFVPRIENLPSQCQAAYTRTIQGCQASDFSTANRCSASCLNGLVDTQRSVISSCRGVDVPETSIIGVFLLGQGIPALCPNAVVTTVGGSSSTRAQNQPQTTTTQGRAASTSSSAPASSSQSSSSTGIEVDTSVPTQTSSFATSILSFPSQTNEPPSNPSPISSTARPTPTQANQRTNGGGSPFDSQFRGSASQLQRLSVGTIGCLLATACIFTAIL